MLVAERLLELKGQNPDLGRRMGMTEAEYQKFLEFAATHDIDSQDAFQVGRRTAGFDFRKFEEEKKRKLAEYLGEERLRQYQQYQDEAPDRGQVMRLRGRLGEADALSDSQADQLITGWSEERRAFQKELEARFGGNATYTTGSYSGASFMASGSKEDEDSMEADMREQMESYRSRMLNRASGVLTPRQLEAYTTMLDGQLTSQRIWVRADRETPVAKH